MQPEFENAFCNSEAAETGGHISAVLVFIGGNGGALVKVGLAGGRLISGAFVEDRFTGRRLAVGAFVDGRFIRSYCGNQV